MSRIAKKHREHHQFEIFREICDGAPPGIACAQECPDFLVRDGTVYTGVELTQYFKPAVPGRRPLQEQHALQAMIVDRAHGIYEEATATRLRVTVLFRGPPLDKRQAPWIAAALAAFVQRCAVSDLQQRFDPWGEGPELRSVTAIYAYKCADPVRALWRIATAGTVRPLETDDVQEIISAKQADIPRYDQRATDNRLVIVLDGSAASFARLTDSAQAGNYVSAFDQVHFLDIAAGTCTDLHVVRQPE